MSNLSKEYTAGFFDGEGCIRVAHNRKDSGSGIHVFITNTYKPILDRIQSMYGGKVTLRNRKNPKHRTCFQWRISNRAEAVVFLRDIEPLLVEKKRQAQLGIEFCTLDPIKANRFTKGDPALRQRKIEIKDELSRLKKIDHAEVVC